MPQGGGQEKTEKATPKKRRDAREKEGNVLQSKEVNTVVSILATFFILFLVGEYMLKSMMDVVEVGISIISNDIEFNNEFFTKLLIESFKSFVEILLPLIAVSIAVPILATVVQTKGLFTMKPLKPKFSKLNPITGVKRLFSMQTVVNVLKGVIVIAVISVMVYTRIKNNFADFQKMPDVDILRSILYISKSTFSLVMQILMVLVFVAGGDYLFQWWQYEKKLKMSKQEVKEEYKQIEGDPKIKAKIKQKQQEMAMGRMMQQVPDADVVVRNPTHYAVAISYKGEDVSAAPKVVAKGKGEIALKIIDIATENNVYIVENRPLAREIYETVEVDSEIPPSLYNAIAVIIADLYAAREKDKSKTKNST